MNIVNKGSEQVKVATNEDGQSLMIALSEYNADSFSRQQFIGKEEVGRFTVNFDDHCIGVMTLEDALTVQKWFHGLGVKKTELVEVEP